MVLCLFMVAAVLPSISFSFPCNRYPQNFWWYYVPSPSDKEYAKRCEKLYKIESNEDCGVCGRKNYEQPETAQVCDHWIVYQRYDLTLDPSYVEKRDKWTKFRMLCTTKDNCEATVCSHRGECRNGFTTYKCYCYDKYFGKDCEQDAGQGSKDSYAVGTDVFYNINVNVSSKFKVIVVVEQKGQETEIIVTRHFGPRKTVFHKIISQAKISDRGSGEKLRRYCKENTDLNKICTRFMTGTDIFVTELEFPVIRELKQVFYYYYEKKDRDYPVGYATNFTVTVKNNLEEKIMFKDDFQIFVTYPTDIHCYQNIVIKNCPSAKILQVKGGEGMTFYGALEGGSIPEPDFGDEALKCYKNDDSEKWTLSQELRDGSSTIVDIKTGYYDSYSIEPFKTQKGYYSLRFSYTVITKYGEIENFDECFLNVTEMGLSAIIIIRPSGSDIINIEEVIELDGSQSYDPNVKDGKKGLRFEWACENILKNISNPCLEDYLALDINKKSVVKIAPNTLTVNHHYRFTLKVSKEGRQSAFSSKTIYMITGAVKSIGLICLPPNCVPNPKAKEGNEYFADPGENITLKAKIVLYDKFKYIKISTPIFEYSENGTTNFTSIDTLKVYNTGKYTVTILGDQLLERKNYIFRVTFPGLSNGTAATARISTLRIKGMFNCTFTPQEGVVGITLFNLTCVTLDDGFRVYELYDKAEKDLPERYSGRMVGTRDMNQPFENFYLTQGHLRIYLYVSRDDGQFSTYQYRANINLIPFNGTDKYVTDMTNLESYFQKNNLESVLNIGSVIPDILQPGMNRSCVVNHLVSYIYRVVKTYEKKTIDQSSLPQSDNEDNNLQFGLLKDVKLSLSSISYILKAMIKNDTKLEVYTSKMCADVLLKLTKFFKIRVKNIAHEVALNSIVVYQMVKTILDTAEIIIREKHSEVLSKPIYLVNRAVLRNLKEISHAIVDTLYSTGESLILEPVENYDSSFKKVESKHKIVIDYAETEEIQDTNNLVQIWETSSEIPFNLSKQLYDKLKRNIKDPLALQLTILNINPYWWGSKSINTDVFILKMFILQKNTLKECHQKLSLRNKNLDLYFNITEKVDSVKIVQGSTTQPSSAMNEYEKDNFLTVYRFDPPVKAKMFIQFLNVENELKVLIKKNLRPNYKMMNTDPETTIITNNKTKYKLEYNARGDDGIYYMGILPGTNASENSVANFYVKVYFTLCETWMDFSWGSYGCSVGEKTNNSLLQCVCSHFSLFGGLVQAPLYAVETVIDFHLFLTSSTNWMPSILVVIIFVLFLLMCLWGWLKDKRDSIKGKIMLLEDNYPGDRYAYLVGVYTGSRVDSSTDANVGIKIFGDKTDSRPHILKSSTRRTLQGNADDWFLLYCQKHLGQITSIEIWHDNIGKSPDWFVERIIIFDLHDRFQYIFELDVWVALEVNEFPDAVATPSTLDEYFNVRKVFLNNFVTGLRDTHYWTSVLWKHPRNPVSRVQRIGVLMGFIMVAMGVSIIFCTSFKGDVKEDDPSFNFHLPEFIAFSISFLVASFAAYVLMSLFRKSFTHRYLKTRSSLVLRPEDMEHRMSRFSLLSTDDRMSKTSLESRKSRFFEISKRSMNKKYIQLDSQNYLLYKERTVFEHFASALHSIARGSSLEPVRVSKYESTVKTNNKYFITAWILFLVLVLVFAISAIYFGFSLTTMKGIKWVTLFLFVILFHALIYSTLKVILFSIILSFAFQRTLPVPNYNVKASDGMQKNLIGNVDFLYKLLEKRSQPMYCPLNKKLQEELRQKRVHQMKWKSCIDFMVVLLLVLNLILLTRLTMPNYFNSNNHCLKMLTNNPINSHLNFENIGNRTHYEEYLILELPEVLYKSMWYNDFPLNSVDNGGEVYWTDDCVTRMFGNARIRQLRVDLTDCPKINDVEVGEYCKLSYDETNEVKSVFADSWYPGDYDDVERKSTAWKYTDKELSGSSETYGKTLTFYHSGGYLQDLVYTEDETIRALSYLITSNWLDHMTRVVFVELTLYNVNTKLFSQVILISEQTASGQYLTNTVVESVGIHFQIDFWRISFIVFLVFFFFRMCILMNRNGFFVYLSQIMNIFEMFLIVLGVTTVVLYCVHIVTAQDYVQQFHRKGKQEFFSFNKVISFITFTNQVLCILLVAVVLRMLFTWRFGRRFFCFYYTMLLSWSWIMWVTLFFMLFLLIAWRLVGYLSNVFIFSSYTTFIVYFKEFFAVGSQTLIFQVMTYIKCLLGYITYLVFVTSFSYYYRVAKGYELIDTDTFNIFAFLIGEVNNKYKVLFKKNK